MMSNIFRHNHFVKDNFDASHWGTESFPTAPQAESDMKDLQPNLVGGWFTRLKNMNVNWDDYSQYIYIYMSRGSYLVQNAIDGVFLPRSPVPSRFWGSDLVLQCRTCF